MPIIEEDNLPVCANTKCDGLCYPREYAICRLCGTVHCCNHLKYVPQHPPADDAPACPLCGGTVEWYDEKPR